MSRTIGGSRGGPGGHVPPLDHSKLSLFFSYFCCWCTCLAKLAHRSMNIAGDERMCGKYLSPASESGRFLEMGYEKSLLLPPPPPLNRAGFWRSRKISATTPPPPLNRAGFWRSRKISATTPPPLNRAGFWRSRKISSTTPPPPVSCCAPPRLPAPDPPLLTVLLILLSDVWLNICEWCKTNLRFPDTQHCEELSLTAYLTRLSLPVPN